MNVYYPCSHEGKVVETFIKLCRRKFVTNNLTDLIAICIAEILYRKSKENNDRKEKNDRGAYYHSIDATLIKKTADTLKNLLHRLNVTEYRITKKAKEIIAELITNTGSNFYIEPPFHCDYGYNIVCGDNVFYVNALCWILHLSL
jgi:hypothetical protein